MLLKTFFHLHLQKSFVVLPVVIFHTSVRATFLKFRPCSRWKARAKRPCVSHDFSFLVDSYAYHEVCPVHALL